MNARTRTAGAKSTPLLLPVVSSAAAAGEEQGARPGRAEFARTPAKFRGLVKRLATIAFVSAAVWWSWVRSSVAPELLSRGTSPPFADAAGSNRTEEQRQQYTRTNTAILRPPVQAKYSRDGCAHVSSSCCAPVPALVNRCCSLEALSSQPSRCSARRC